MKLFPLAAMGMFALGCAGTPQQVKATQREQIAPYAEEADCRAVLNHITDLQMQDYKHESNMSEDEVQIGRIMLEAMYSHKREWLFNTCLSVYNTHQTACLIDASSFDVMTLCIATIKSNPPRN